jgi:hypothetical protein
MNKSSINKAYLEVMRAIQQIKDVGIKVEMSYPTSVNNENLIKKYEDRLPPKLWKLVTFYPITKFQRDLIHQYLIKLGELGILFDTGCGCEGTNLEIDWSLRIEKDSDYIDEVISAKKLIKDITSEHFPLPNVH